MMQQSPLVFSHGAHKQRPCQSNKMCCFRQILVLLWQGGGGVGVAAQTAPWSIVAGTYLTF